MKICLINPPSRFGGAPLPHMGIAYIGGMVTETFPQATVEVIDCPFQGISSDDLREQVVRERYDLIGVTTYFYNFMEVFKLVRYLNTLKPKPFIILGGYYPTLHPQKTFSIPGVDCICVGEGEYAFRELVEKLEKKEDWRQIQGLAYLDDQGQFIENPPAPLLEELDSLPRPLLPQEPLYWYPLTSGRGCHGRCTFCSIVDYYRKVPGKKIRKRSPESVVEELKWITDQYQHKIIWMMDDNFFAVMQEDGNWIERFAKLVKAEKIACKFKIFARADEIDAEILRQLQEVGLIGVVVGVESMVERQLKLYGKGITPETNWRAMDILRERGLWLDLGFILLDPYTTLAELKTNLEFLRTSAFIEVAEPGHELISSLGPLIALEDSPIHRYLKARDVLSGTEVGYNFQDAEISFFYEGLRLWNQFIAPRYFEFNSQQMFVFYSKHGYVNESFLKAHRACLKIDIAFMWELLDAIEKHGRENVDIRPLVEQFAEQMFAVISGSFDE